MAKYRIKKTDPDQSICAYLKEAEKKPAPPEDAPLNKRDLWAMERIAIFLERSKLNSYVEMMGKPLRWMLLNLWGGIGRGIGMAIGFTILGAVVFIFLQKIVMLNLPVISNFFAEILDMVQSYRSVSP